MKILEKYVCRTKEYEDDTAYARKHKEMLECWNYIVTRDIGAMNNYAYVIKETWRYRATIFFIKEYGSIEKYIPLY